jgi:GlpG protein
MREIGKLPSESDAQIFGDYLYIQGISHKIEAEQKTAGQQKEWVIWVYSEDHYTQAKSLLTEYLSGADTLKFREATESARKKRSLEKEEMKLYRKRIFSGKELFQRYDRIGPLTIILIVVSILVTIVALLGHDNILIRYLFITEYFDSGLTEIRHGQIWRLLTPIFIHFGFLHIVFNMLWLRDLGSMIERRQSTATLAGLVVVIGVFSNVGQYLISGPTFGGMSGVVYGLLGYIWIRGKYDYSSGLFVHHQTVAMMIIWFFVCFTGLVGNIANTAHAIGFATGIIWGFLAAKIATRR